ncbi:hypothetical protein I5Q34_03235 [Streptomyces sp. AV19]|uniref:hypothetical protein n=1 Tax=Streptomyces sp. AV19 TaxID=2793068 RepID=UPI0018FE3345|nr:hypothetical protein [Streptomyces sp. AV19]MBH1933311.1 hypothetical protein [Streptomyces sp. AV19]MDG4531921.1 hypothetical protein [Streptomyces sp. AV19]
MASSARRRHHGLPPGAIPPEPLRWVGLTWLDRGPAYWWHRFTLSLFLLVTTALTAAMGAAVVTAAVPDGAAVLTVVLVVYALLGIGVACFTLRDIRTLDRRGVVLGGGLGTAALGKRLRAMRTAVAAAAVVLGSVLLILAVPVACAALFTHLIRSFGRYTIGERHERERLGLDV